VNFYQWSKLSDSKLMAGIAGKRIVGERVMVCRFRYDPHVVEPVHSHENEQFSWVIEGRVKFLSVGEQIDAGPGDVVYFASNVPHGVQVLDEPAEMVEIFSPLRPDLIAAMREPGSSSAGEAE
jgi:quercetin dioxygenase-like cupin family protein